MLEEKNNKMVSGSEMQHNKGAFQFPAKEKKLNVHMLFGLYLSSACDEQQAHRN